MEESTSTSSKTLISVREPTRKMMERPGLGRRGQVVKLLTNHARVRSSHRGSFYHYNVTVTHEDGPVVGSAKDEFGRRIVDRVYQIYASELGHNVFAYDGDKGLFTWGPLAQKTFDLPVVMEGSSSISTRVHESGGNDSLVEGDTKRLRRHHSKNFVVSIQFAAKIPIQSQEALRVFDIIIKQDAVKQGCFLVRQSSFHNEPRNFANLGGGVLSCLGFYSSFHTTQGGISLITDASATVIIQPGPVIEFLLDNQNKKSVYDIDWGRAKRTLKNLMIKITSTKEEHKIKGLSEKNCNKQKFLLKSTNGEEEITVYDYYIRKYNMELHNSADFPCINVGNAKRPKYYPLELCDLVSLQRYKKALSVHQRSVMIEKSRQKPIEKMRALSNELKRSNYGAITVFGACGVSIDSHFVQVEGRVLSAPKLRAGHDQEFSPERGRWNLNNKSLLEPMAIQSWVAVNFSARCDTRSLCQDLMKCAQRKGIDIRPPLHLFQENPDWRRDPPTVRVQKMFNQMESTFRDPPQFILCILPERKNSNIYGPWKKRALLECGVPTQCVAPSKINDQYLTNVLLKINAKLGGLNSKLAMECSKTIPIISKVPTIIFGMDVSHGQTGQCDVPSIAAVASSRHWPSVSRYRASVRAQSPKTEMIDSLFEPTPDGKDRGIIQELLRDFYASSGTPPMHIIIFRDGVSESQFSQVLNIELEQIIQACRLLDSSWSPKFTVIVAQKIHHTKFFLHGNGSQNNVPPGTVVDNTVCHPQNNDFYICAHAGMIGTTRPTHYHVLLDEIGFPVDDLQELVHSLCYVYQRSTTAVSVVAPVYYAHLAAAQMSQCMKFDDGWDGSSSAEGISTPVLPALHPRVSSSMFFC